MKYFEKFPTIPYPYYGKLVTNPNSTLVEFIETIDLHVRFRIKNTYSRYVNAFYTHTLLENDTPDKIAHFYYGDSYYDWLVMLSNQFFDNIHDFPLSESALNDYIQEKYNVTFEESLMNTHHYEDGNGFVIDYDTYFITPEPKKVVSIYDHEYIENEKKRTIKLLSKAYLYQMDRDLDGMLSNIRNARELYNG